MHSRTTQLFLGSLCALAINTSAMTGIVKTSAGAPLPGVVVRSSLRNLTDTTDASGAWSLATSVGISGATRSSISLEGNRVVADLAGPEKLVIDGFDANGKRWIHREENLGAGHHMIALGAKTIRGGSYVRVRSSAGVAVMHGARVAEVVDSISFRLAGFMPVVRILTASKDTLLTVMTPTLAQPGAISVSDLNATTSTVSWAAVPSATGYIVTLSGALGGSPRDTTVSTTGFIVTNMVPGKNVRVRIRAIDGLRVSDSSTGVAMIHRAPLAPQSVNHKVLDTIQYNILPFTLTIYSAGFKHTLSMRVYNEATPFLDTTYSMPSKSVTGYVTLKIPVGSTKIPVIDSTAWIRVVALDSVGDSAICRILVKPVKAASVWNIDFPKQSVLKDNGPNRLDLSWDSYPFWSRAADSLLTHPLRGRIFYQAKIYLDAYPTSHQTVMGIYGSLEMKITPSGQLSVVSQRGASRSAISWAWYGALSEDSAVPLKRWVTLAVGADDLNAQLYAWIDGVPVILFTPTNVIGSALRPGYGSFVLGGSSNDVTHSFPGQIKEAKADRRFLFDPGAAPAIDSTIDD